MKNLENLLVLVERLKKKETTRLKKYGVYKQKKNALKLLEIILQHKEEPDRLELEIKRKGLKRNLRYAADELYKLLLDFWEDSASETNLSRDIHKMIIRASIINHKGLKDEAIKLYKKAADTAKSHEFYDLHLFANYFVFANELQFNTKNRLQSSNDFLAEQLNSINRAKSFYTAFTLYTKTHHLITKGIQMLDKEERNQLLEIRSSAKDLINKPGIPFRLKTQMTMLLADLHLLLSPTNFQLSDQYYLRSIKQLQESTFSQSTSYLTVLYNYLNFLYRTRRINDFIVYYNIFLEAGKLHQEKEIYNSTRIAIVQMLCSLKHEKETAEKIIYEASEFVKENRQLSFTRVTTLLFNCFELSISIGDLEQAATSIEQLNTSLVSKTDMKQHKFIFRLASLLVHYENDNHEWILNQVESIRRLYSSHLKSNYLGRTFMKLIANLSASNNKATRDNLLTNFLSELKESYEQHPEDQFYSMFSIIEDWAAAKLHGSKTIFDYKKSVAVR